MNQQTEAAEEQTMVLGPSPADWDWLNLDLSVDAIVFEIIRHKLEVINEEQALALKEVSVSPIVTAASDFNNAIYSADGRIISMGPQVVFHSGAMPIVLRHVMEAYSSDEIEDGDMFAVNDPFYGAVHHPDVSLLAPIFIDGKLSAWAGVAAHQVDMGGMSVGSISGKARERIQEGLMMPPIKLIERGKLRKDVWRLILNMTRQPEMVALDLRGFVASNVVARKRLQELAVEYDRQTVITVMEELIRYSERRMRERLLELPDAVAHTRSFIDHDGISNRLYRTDVRVTKRGDVLTFDLSDSSPQALTYINCTEGALVGAIFGGTAPLLGAGIPWNHGILNAVEVIAPEGLIVNAKREAPTGAATIGQGWTIMSATSHAVSKLLALSRTQRHNSAAITHGTFAALFTGERNQHGEPYTTQLIDAQIGGGGASAVADGIDQSGAFVAPKPHIANVESNEMHGPMLFLYRAFFPDTGGDGEHRGGRAAGTAWTPHGVERLINSITTHGVEVPVSYGQLGGLPGVCNRQMVIKDTDVRELQRKGQLPMPLDSVIAPLDISRLGGRVEPLAAKQDEFTLHKGDVVQYTWQGGGGYGDPLLRSPASVERDIELGLISADRGRQIYGLVQGMPEETRKRRDEIRGNRLKKASSPERTFVIDAAGEPGETLIGYGEALVVERRGRDLFISCRCGSVGSLVAPAQEDWKAYAAVLAVEGDLRPEGIRVHDELELVAYICPSCGSQHSVDVKERTEPPPEDLKILATAEQLMAAHNKESRSHEN